MAMIPTTAQLAAFGVTNPQSYEALTQTLFDFQAYAAAGQTTLSFFSVPQGQSGKTADDTNLNLSGQIPAQQFFLCQGVEVPFYPTVPAVTAQNPATFGAQAIAQIVNDVYIVYHTGNLAFVVGSKPYLNEAPLGRFPGSTHMQVDAALADVSTAGSNFQSRIAFAYAAGRPYRLGVWIMIAPNMSFNVSLNWASGVAALPSGNPGRIGVILDGILYRQSQ